MRRRDTRTGVGASWTHPSLRTTGLLVALSALFHAITFLYFPFLSSYYTNQGFQLSTISAGFSFFSLTALITLGVIGKKIDHWSPRLLLTIGALLQAGSIVFFIIDQSFVYLVLGRIMEAISFYFFFLTITKLIEMALKNSVRGKGTGWINTIERIGRGAGVIAGAFLAPAISLRWTMAVAAVLSIVLLALIALLPKTKPDTENSVGDPEGLTHPAPAESSREGNRFLRDRRFLPLVIIGWTFNLSGPVLPILLPLQVLAVGGHLAGVSWIFLTDLMIAALASPLIGKWIDRYGRKSGFFIASILTPLALLLLIFSSQYWMVLLLVGLSSLGATFYSVSAVTYLNDHAGEGHQEGSVMASFYRLMRGGEFVGYWVLAGLGGVLISRQVFLVLAVVIFVTCFLAIPWLREVKRERYHLKHAL